ncbi:MAG: hypothetical protein A3I14_08980 [Candidatus Rokubacteria bacterium RIFCSPLOWO2_02_FULL_73_56]|nr:MAG: hypothetical protein A3D33_00630 [Candidatus Rokubacteria bacterium RIFCSPHIGHO2_02_FULL_73_26]OGL09445.1 MAG: hypothetical protein A3I14_08980 [Candidatus Rokubacteria bacterium RIFCSPLOWO2_02_FULL_73_56]OGL25168.1 MAG: hypothetical protein A3G44_05645 [Candidatus Rokubacteria bacterium RIFCSPLOWO2_12_FULL_73_47]
MLLVGLGGTLLLGGLAFARAEQLAPPAATAFGPPLDEIEKTWTSFWTAIATGDVAGARQYVHSYPRSSVPRDRAPQVLLERSREMAHCRLVPPPFPVSDDEVAYRVVCEHAGERAESVTSVRRDRDGVWRLSSF